MHRPLADAVRIIGGRWKRSRLPVGDVPSLRPTPARVRETLFNWLGQDLTDWRCLDAFAGSGALGFEAASRGAREVVLVESDRGLARALAEVKQRLGADAVRIEQSDALAWMARSPVDRFDVVFLDPPFGSRLVGRALEAAARVVAPGGFVYVESEASIEPSAAENLGLRPHRAAKAGAVHFALLERSAESAR